LYGTVFFFTWLQGLKIVPELASVTLDIKKHTQCDANFKAIESHKKNAKIVPGQNLLPAVISREKKRKFLNFSANKVYRMHFFC
jgi:hypothetical protein